LRSCLVEKTSKGDFLVLVLTHDGGRGGYIDSYHRTKKAAKSRCEEVEE